MYYCELPGLFFFILTGEPGELILDGNSEHVAHVWNEIDLLGVKNLFVTALDPIRCLNKSEIKIAASCAPISYLGTI